MAARIKAEEGLTLVEVVIAMFIGLLGALTLAQIITATERNSYRAEQSQVVATMLQAELERIKQLPYSQIALTSSPEHVNDERHPGSRVQGASFGLQKDGGEQRPLVVNGGDLVGGGVVFGGSLNPGPATFEGGDVSGAVFRYVVWIDDPGCPESLCPGAQDLKRVIVVAVLDSAPSGERHYQEIHTDIADPDAVPVENALPPRAGDEGTYVTFWLTDTPCSAGSRQALTGSHPTHNTLGECVADSTSGSLAGAPDLLSNEPPPLGDGGTQILHDYSTDLEPSVRPDGDRGLQLRSSSCEFDPSSQSQPHHRTHRWLTGRVPPNGELELEGHATLALWTRSINGYSERAGICVVLFVRRPLPNGGHEDVLLRNAAGGNTFPHVEEEWPTDWREIAVSMEFDHTSSALRGGERLGVAISGVTAGNDPALEFMYDNPSFDTRLVVRTSGEVPQF